MNKNTVFLALTLLGCLALFAIAGFGLPKAVAAKLNKANTYGMTDEQWRDLTRARDGIIGAQEKLNDANFNFNAILKQIHDDHDWPAQVVFDTRSMTWGEKPTEEVKTRPGSRPKPAEPAKPPESRPQATK
jgi:hypothetical protein